MTTSVYDSIIASWTLRERQLAKGETGIVAEETAAILSDNIRAFETRYLPNGSGFDVTPQIVSASRGKVVIHGSYHAMNEAGYYDGRIDFTVIARPSRHGIAVAVKARGMRWPRKYADLREDISETYCYALSASL